MRVLVLGALLGMLVVACGDPPGASEATGLSVKTESPPSGVSTEEPSPAERMSSMELPEGLARGEHRVFGIQMPRGMIPVGTPSKEVHRFEGTHSIAMVKSFLEEQLHPPLDVRENRFSDGYLIQRAQARTLDSTTGDNRRVTVKIFNGSLGGATVDIWPDSSMPSDRNPSFVESYERIRKPSRERRSDEAQQSPESRLMERQERLRSTFRVIDKIARQQPLTEEDYQSPYFTEL